MSLPAQQQAELPNATFVSRVTARSLDMRHIFQELCRGVGHCVIFVTAISFVSGLGCSAPSAANIALRKQVQSQQVEIDTLKRLNDANVASLRAWQPTTGPAPAPALTAAQAAAVFTTHGIRLGKLTGGVDSDLNVAGDDGLSVRVVPTDDSGDDLKAAGTITVEAFDLADNGRRLGQWTFSTAQARPLWNGEALRYEYVVPCSWQERPRHRDLTIKVTFLDALTGRSFDAQQVVSIRTE